MKKLWIKRNSNVHGYGLFAKHAISKGIKIIEYVGEKITKKEGDYRADEQIAKALKEKGNGKVYIFELNKKYDIDGQVRYNHARFINHSCSPNCEVENIRNRLWILSKKNIRKGDEISYNYGYPYDSDYKDHKCNCGSPNCLGYILKKNHWKKITN